MTSSSDVLVVGAGIVGVACAYELAQAGCSVQVIDSGPAGAGATAAGMGHILVLDGSPAETRISHYANQLWRELSEELPSACAYERCGTIWIAEDQEELDAVAIKKEIYDAQGLSTQVLNEMELSKLEPNLRPGLPGGLLVEDDSIVYAPAVTEFLVQKAERLGVEFHLGKTVVSISDGKATLADGETVEADIVVNATGHCAAKLTPGLPVIPRKGHLMITDRYPGYVSHELIELGYVKSAHGSAKESVAFNVQPRPTGQLLLGSTRQFGDETDEIRPDILKTLLKRIELFLPKVRDLNVIRCWTGFRAATPDKLPIIGKWPNDDRLYLATGHEGLGITLALPTARVLTAQIIGKPSPFPADAYLPDRFEEGVAH